MLYVLICTDKKDSEDLRKEVRPDHLNYLSDFDIKLAGPMLDDDQKTMVGSIILIECQNKDEAEAFAEKDPYNLAGLFERVHISAFRQAIPTT
jgi:hypothetical protein